MANVGYATLQIIPSLKGVEAAVATQLGGAEAAAATAGKKTGGAFSTGLAGAFAAIKTPVGATIATIAGVGVAAFAAAESVEKAQKLILRATGETGEGAEKLLDSFKAVASQTPASFQTVAQAISEVSQRTGLTGEALELFTRQVITFNRITKDAPVNVQDLTKALSAFGVPAEQMSAKFDELFKASQRTGVPITDLLASLQKSGPILRQFGLPVGEAAAFITQLDKAGVEASPIIAGLRAAFVKFAKAGKEPGEALRENIKAINDFIAAGDLASARKLGVELFGARGSGLVDAAIQGKLSLDGLNASLNETGKGILQTSKDTGTISGKLGVLKNNLVLALEPLGRPLLDALNAGLGAIVPLVQAAVAGITPLFENFGKVAQPVIDNLVLGFNALVAAFRDPDITSDGFVGFMEQVGVVARSVFDNIIKFLPDIIREFQSLGTAIVDAFKPVAAAIKEAAPPILSLLGTLGKAVLPVLLAAAIAVGAVFVKVIVPAFKFLLPVVGQVLATLIKFTGILAKNKAAFAALVIPIAAVGAALLIQKAAFAGIDATIRLAAAASKAFTTVQAALNAVMAANPVVLVALAIGALAAGFILAYQKIKPFHDAVDAVGRALKDAFEFVARNWKLIGALLLAPILPFVALAAVVIANWKKVVDFFKTIGTAIVGAFNALINSGFAQTLIDYVTNTFNNIRNVIEGVLNIIRGIFNAWKALFSGDWGALWDSIKQIVEGVWQVIAAIIEQGINLVTTTVKLGLEVMKDIVSKAIDGVIDFFAKMPGRILDLIPKIASAAVAVGTAIITSVIKGLSEFGSFVTDIADAVGKAFEKAWNKFVDVLNAATPNKIDLPGPIDINLPDNPWSFLKFAQGGVVPGPLGAPVLAIVHGGEEVLTPEQRGAQKGVTINQTLVGSTVTAPDLFRAAKWAQLTGQAS